MHVNRLILAAAVGMSLVTGAIAAPPKGKNMGPAAKPTESATAVDNLRTAAGLVRYGNSAKDPLALIAAAKIIKDTGTTDSKAERVGGKAGDAKNKPDALSADVILEKARTLATGRPDLLAVADDVAKAGARGAVGGPGRTTTIVSSGGTDVFRVRFRGNEPARVAVSGDGDSDLDLYIYDENNNLICKDDDSTDDMTCAWSPRWTGAFTIRIRNRGIANQYTIWHN